jgi:hypothetical protein
VVSRHFFDAPTVEDMVYLTINQRSGNDSPRFMGINSRRRSLCPLDVETSRYSSPDKLGMVAKRGLVGSLQN